METELWKQSYRLPNKYWVMGPTIFELWVMKTENWVTKIGNPNKQLLTLVIVRLDSYDTDKLFPQTKSSNYSQLICAANRPNMKISLTNPTKFINKSNDPIL